MKRNIYAFILLILLLKVTELNCQNFKEVLDSPVSNTNLDDFWTGSAWIDIDNDKDLDLFVINRIVGREQRKNKVYINDKGKFKELTNSPLVDDLGYWFSITSGDYNRDGLIDIYVAGFPGALYKNLGGGKFEKIKSGKTADPKISGICAGFGDFNNDGYLDLLVTRPDWIQAAPWCGPPTSPHLLINKGAPDFDFKKVEYTDISIPEKDTYMQATLFDLDDDNDLDIFIGMGSGKSKIDLMYKNMYTETKVINFKRWLNVDIANALVEGNQWSFHDIDNDGDWDAHITNWATVVNDKNVPSPNFLFKNENGKFIKIENQPIVVDSDMTTTSLWGDYDNDADIDVIMVSDSTYTLKYYENDGLGNFKSKRVGDLNTINKHQSGGSVGDFDNDGDLDLFIPGPGKNNSFLKNNLNNKNNWIKLKLVGKKSNSSAIGSKVWLTIISNNKNITQRRLVSTSNVYFGHNSIIQHFGINTSKRIKELKVMWPSGIIEKFNHLKINKTNTLNEGEGTRIISTDRKN